MNIITLLFAFTVSLLYIQPVSSSDGNANHKLVYKFEMAPPLNLELSYQSSHAAGRLLTAHQIIAENPFFSPVVFVTTRHSYSAFDREHYLKGQLLDKTDQYGLWLKENQESINHILKASELTTFLPSQGNIIYNYNPRDPRLKIGGTLTFTTRILSHDSTRQWAKGNHKGAIDRTNATLRLCELTAFHQSVDPPRIYVVASILHNALRDFEWMLNSPYCTPEDAIEIHRSLQSIDLHLFYEIRKAYTVYALAMLDWTKAQLDQQGASLEFWKLHQQANKAISDFHKANNLNRKSQPASIDPTESAEQLYKRVKSGDLELESKLASLTAAHELIFESTHAICQDLLRDARDPVAFEHFENLIKSIDSILPDLLSLRSLGSIVSSTDSSEKQLARLIAICEQKTAANQSTP